MIASLAAKGLLAAVLVLSLSLKVTGAAKRDDSSESRMRAETLAFIERSGFRVSKITQDLDLVLIAAGNGRGCKLTVAIVSLQGWHRHLMHQIVLPDERLAFVFGGALYPDQPIWRTRMQHYWNQVHRYAGLPLPLRPVLAVIAGPACDLGPVKWQETAMF